MTRCIAVALTLVTVHALISIPPASAQQPKRSGLLRIADRESPNLDPSLKISFLTQSWSNMIYSQLVRCVRGREQKHHSSFSVAPDLAE
jgi:hypothetical protein